MGNQALKKQKLSQQNSQQQQQQQQVNQNSQINKISQINQNLQNINSQNNSILISEQVAKELENPIQINTVEVQQDEISQIDQDAKMSEQLERLHLKILPKYQSVSLTQDAQILPILIQIETIKSQIKHLKANIDLVCVVDVSGSMEGQKLKLVKDSLRYIQKIMDVNDRISLVTFSTRAGINLPWTINKEENKEKIKKAIVDMYIRDSTNIASGVQLGLRMIRDRKYKNPVTCMFVLSDGQDDDNGADLRCQQALLEYQIQDTFVINTFGYGTDHDAKVMNNIANLKGGNFTFIEKIEKASEHFILAMSGMLSVFGKNIKLLIEQNELYPISKIYGDQVLWKYQNGNQYEQSINFILEGDKKEFILELQIPSSEKINFQQDKVLKAQLTGEFIQITQPFIKQAELILQFSLQNLNENANEIVEINHLRVKAGEAIGEANLLAKQKKYDQAQQILNKMLNEIENSQFKDNKILEVVCTDIEQIKKICKPQQFEQLGEALMLNKQRNHIQRQRSINNSLEWNSDEEQQMEDLKQGNLQLSCCDYAEDYQKDAQLDDCSSPLQFQQRRGSDLSY